MIKVGDRMPAGTFTLITKDGPQKVNAEDYFKGKKVVLFSVPGAFTPTCDAKHLPGFVEKAGEIKGKGVDTRSEERRVGKECRSRWSPYHYKKKGTYEMR